MKETILSIHLSILVKVLINQLLLIICGFSIILPVMVFFACALVSLALLLSISSRILSSDSLSSILPSSDSSFSLELLAVIFVLLLFLLLFLIFAEKNIPSVLLSPASMTALSLILLDS